MKDVNHEIIIDTLLWYKIWQLSGYNPTRVKLKLPRNPRSAYRSSWSRRGNPKSFTLTNSLKFGKACEDLSWNHSTSFHHTDQKQMGLLREQYEESRKGHLRYCCNQVWKKNGGRISCNATAICEIFRIFCLMGRHPMKGGSEYLFMAQVVLLEQW